MCWLGLACGPAVDDGGSASGAATSGDGASASSEAVSSDSVGSTTEPSPGTCEGDTLPACQSYCAAAITCMIESGPYESCVTACVDALAEATPTCRLATCEALACYGTLGCEELQSGSSECTTLEDAIPEECSEVGTCDVFADSDGSCGLSCDDGSSFDCDAAECRCTVEDAITATCPSNGVCDGPEVLSAYAAKCCGW